MIIEITIEPDYVLSDSDKDILVNISMSHKEASHFFICKPKSFELFNNQVSNERLIHSSLLSILKQTRQSLAIIQSVAVVTKVVFGHNRIKEIIDEDGQSIRIYSHHYISGTKELLPVIILAENDTDANFYHKLGRVYSEDKLGGTHIYLNTEHMGGGGDTTAGVFEKLHSQYSFRPFYCIADSDKSHPRQPHFGGTAKKIIQKSVSKPELNNHFSILNMMELENILPAAIIDMVNASDNQQRSAAYADSIANLYDMEQSHHDSYLFLDLKKGITFKEAIKLDRSHGSFWLRNRWATIRDECRQQNDCHCNPCCHIIRKGPDGLLEKGLAAIQNKSLDEIKAMTPPHLWSLWINYGKIIFTWGCSRPNSIHAL